MAVDSRTLEILLKVLADTKGADEVKGKLQDIANEAKGAGSVVGELAGLIGAGIGGAAVSGVLALANEFINLRQREAEFAEETRKTNQLLGTQESHWSSLATTAGRYMDVVRLGFEILPQIQKFSDELTAAQQKQLTFTQQIADVIGKGLIGGKGPIQLQQSREEIEKLKDLIRVLKDYREGTERSLQSIDEWQRVQAGPVADAIGVVDQKMSDLKAKIDGIDPIKALPDAQKAKQLAGQLVDLNREYGIWAERRERLQKQLDRESESEDKSSSVNRELTAVMREQSAVLQSITQQRQLIEASPFLSADQKQSLLLSSYVSEIQQLQGALTALNTQKASGLLDPAQLAQVNKQIQEIVFKIQLLTQRVSALKAPLTSELVGWANSFGTTWQQVGRSIEESVNTSLSSLNQLLLTGKGNAQQLLQQLANIGLQLLEHIAIQQIMAALARTNQAANLAMGPATAAAWAPAAAATSVATSGTSAVVGESAALAAIFAIMGALIAHEGGELGRGRIRRMHSGGLAHDEVPIIAQEGEFMVRREVAQQVMPFLMALNSGMLFHGGGLINLLPRYHGGQGIGPNDYQVQQLLNEPWALDQVAGPLVDVITEGGGAAMRNELGIDSSIAALTIGMLSGFGIGPSFGFSPFGPTMDSTFWVNYPGVGNVPMAVPPGGWSDTTATKVSRHTPAILPHHSGGPIGSSFSLSSFRLPRLHGGGIARGGSAANIRSGDVNVAAFIDQRMMAKWLQGRRGRSIIFDTMRGNRIDLGIR